MATQPATHHRTGGSQRRWADSGARRLKVASLPGIEERLPQAARVWGMPVELPGGGRWLVVWREVATAIEIGYIGLAPGRVAG
jgi:hypothetical protein